jgi:hypothetical protein
MPLWVHRLNPLCKYVKFFTNVRRHPTGVKCTDVLRVRTPGGSRSYRQMCMADVIRRRFSAAADCCCPV